MENGKKLFVQAFMEAEQINNSKLKNEDEISWEPSEKFEKSMNSLIRKNNHIKLSIRRKVKRGLLAAIIAVVVMFTGLMSVSASRQEIIKFIEENFPQHTQVELSKDSTLPVNKIETEYTLTDLPDGYKISEYQKEDHKIWRVWKNQNGEEIVFSQQLLNTSIGIDNEHNYKEFDINGYKAYLLEYDSSSILLWTDGDYWFTIIVPASCKEDIMMLQKNICEKN